MFADSVRFDALGFSNLWLPGRPPVTRRADLKGELSPATSSKKWVESITCEGWT